MFLLSIKFYLQFFFIIHKIVLGKIFEHNRQNIMGIAQKNNVHLYEHTLKHQYITNAASILIT